MPVKTIILERLVTRITKSEPREPIPRYQTPFSLDVEGMDPLKKLTMPKFTLYNGKFDPRSYTSHVGQMMAL